MALEFDCPYCKAIIRVPDNSAGKRGRCPQCATKITIPKLGQARRAGEEQPFFPGPPDPASVVPAEPATGDDVIFEEFDPAQSAGIDPQLQAALPPGDIALPDLGGAVRSTLPPPVRQLPDSLLSKHRSRRRTPGWVWVLIVILILGGGGAAGSIYWFQQSVTLTGEFEGQTVENTLPVTIVPKSLVELPPEESEAVFLLLEKSPRSLGSTVGLATVNFQGSDRGLLVTVLAGSATSLYRVEILSDKKLKKHLREHGKEYERVRDENLSVAVNEMFRALKKETKSKSRKSTASDLQTFRDSVGFTAPVQGLGYFVAATHRKQIYPCVHEDDEALYFLLPPGVKHFQIRGKPSKRGEPFFPGVYDVEVTGSVTLRHADEEPEPKSPKKKPSSEEDSESMPDESDEMEMSSEK